MEKPCKDQNVNICIAEGCYNESCLKESNGKEGEA